MGKPYVYWRTPTGQPYKGDDGRFAPTALLGMIGEKSSINPEGNICWPSLPGDELSVREAAAIIDQSGKRLNEADSKQIIWDAIRKSIKTCGGGVALKPADVLQFADSLAASHFRKAVEPYFLVSSLSIEGLPARRLKVRGLEVLFEKSRSGFPIPAGMEADSEHSLLHKHLVSSKYSTVRIQTEGRTIHEAAETALDVLHLLRGIWTFFATFGSWSLRFGATAHEPIAVIHAGPVHTLHRLDRSLATDLYWFEPDYAGDRKLFKPDDWQKIEKQRRWALRRMSRHPYSEDIEQLLIRYAIALDNVNFDAALLQLWSILEKMTDTVGLNYDETIKRASWIFQDRPIAKDLLEHLRFRRNHYVHAGKSGDERDRVVYMAKRLVEPHLLRLIRDDFKVSSLREYGQVLSLPNNLDILKTSRKHLNKAIQMHKKATK